MEHQAASLHAAPRPSHLGLSSLVPGPLQTLGGYIGSLDERLSYLFNGNGASAAQVGFKICAPSV